jgi:hypothetical protein
MIWFTCKQCGKVHGRAESTVGTMVFCDCGQGNLVPWESTIAEPEQPPPGSVPPPPVLEPVAFPKTESTRSPEARRSRRRSPRRFDPNFCLNHESVPSQSACVDCGEGFCGQCLLTFQGESLCGPCKNVRVRRLTKPPQLSTRAVISVVLAILTGPLALCLVPISQQRYGLQFLIALVPHAIALILGVQALRDTADPKVSGRALALTGVLTASVASLLTIILTIYAPRLG